MKLPQLKLQKNKDLRYIYAIRLLRELVNKLVIFFLPIYFFRLHFPFWDQLNFALLKSGQPVLTQLQLGIFNIALLYVVSHLISFFSAITIAKLTVRKGTSHAFVMGHILYALFIFCLLLSQRHPYWVFLAMFIDGIQINYFWNSFYYSLSRNSQKNKMGKNLGLISFLLNFITMISPALGGIIIAVFGYDLLFLLGLVLVLSGIVFAVSLNNVKVHDKISWNEFKSWMTEPGFRRLASTFAGRYFNDAALNLWPLYIFILLGSTDNVGFLYSASLLFAMLLSYVLGNMIDKNNNRQPYIFSGGLLSFFWLGRTLVSGVWSIAIVNTLDRITASYHWLFFDRVWLLRGKGREGLSYFTYRQMIYAVAALIFWTAVFFLFYFFGAAWTTLFVVAAVGVLLTLLVKEHQDPK